MPVTIAILVLAQDPPVTLTFTRSLPYNLTTMLFQQGCYPTPLQGQEGILEGLDNTTVSRMKVKLDLKRNC